MIPKLGPKMEPSVSQTVPKWARIRGQIGPPKRKPKGAINWIRIGFIGVPSGLARSSDSGQGLVEVAELRSQFVLGQPNMRSLPNRAMVMPRAIFETYRARCFNEAMSELFLVIASIRINKM